MGVFGQLGALLRKNFLIRKRHPTFLVLEILWPVLLFVALALMRLGFPPDHRKTCEYPERALPGAGLVPFLQSSICTLDNNCSERSWIAERQQAQLRFQEMIQEIDPLLTKPTTIEAFRSLPTVTVVLNAIKDVVNGTTIDKIDQKLVLRNMFRDPEEVVNILSDKYKILDRRVASALLDSSLNALALVSGIGMVDFKGIVCDPDELEKYIILSDKNNKYVVNKYSVSTSLCRIADDKISEITNDLVRQLDVANIIRLAQDLANVTGSFDTATLFEDIANLVDMYMDSSSVLALLSNVPDLGVLPDIIRQMAKLVPMLNDMADIDFANIGAILDLTTPLIKLVTNDTMLIDSLQTAMASAAKMMSALQGNIDPASIVENMPELANMTGMLYGLGLPGVTYSAPFSQLGDFYNFFSGNMSQDDFSSLSMNETLDFVEGLMRSLYSNETADLMMAMATNTMEMVKDVQLYYRSMESGLKYAVTNSDDVMISLNKLGEAGPDVAYTFMAEIVTFENFYSLMSGGTTAARLCENAVTVAYKALPGYDHSTTVATVCSQAATQMIDQVFVNNSFSGLTGKLEVHMSDMDSMMVQGVIPAHQDIMSMTDMYYEMQTTINDLMATSNSDLGYIVANTHLDYYGDYNWVWNNIAERYNYQTMLFLPIMIVGRAAENSPMWRTVFSPAMEISDAILNNAVHRIKLFEDMNAQDKILTKVFKYLTYYPDIVESAVGQNISKLVRVLGQNDTVELSRMLCEDTQWSNLDVQAEVSVEDMRQFICTTNLTKLVEDIWNIADPMSFLNDVETDVQESLETGIKWSRMASYIQYIYETFRGDNTIKELLTTVFQTDFSRIMSYYKVMENYITKMTMQGITSDMENASEMEMTLQSLDKALEAWDLWKRVKHYIRTWTLMAKILNEFGQLTADPDFDIIAYMEGTSPTLGKYFSNATSTMPEILDAIQDIVNKPQQLVERMLGIDFLGFCDDPNSMSSLLGVQATPDIEQFQNGLCQLNWTAILEESEDDSNWSSFFIQWRMILTYDTASLPPISLNWTDVITTTQKFMENANSGMFNNFMPDLYNFGLNGVNASISNLTSALQNTWMLNTQQLAGSIDQLTRMLLDLPGGNDTFAEMWKFNMAMQSYITYHFFTFINMHLDIINSTRTLNLQAHVNSTEADKLFMLMQRSPEANAVLLYNMRKLASGMPGEWLSIDFMNMCNDTSKLESALEIPASANITKMEVIDAVCAAVALDKLWTEMRAGVPGLQELLDALDKVFSTNVTTADLIVNYTLTSLAIERYSTLLTNILESDIQLVGLPLTTEGELNRLMEQFNDFPMEILADWNTTDPMQLLQNSQNQTLQSLKGLQEVPGMREVIVVAEMYMQVLNAMVTQSDAILMDPVAGFQGYPEMYKMWQMMEWLPQLYTTFIYTSLVDNHKISFFVETLTMGGPEALCQKDPAALMTNPPFMNIQFADFYSLFCSVNFTLLQDEVMVFIQQKKISDTYDNLGNLTDTADIEALMSEYELLSKAVEQFISKTSEFKIPGFDNLTIWEKATEFLGNVSMERANITALQYSQNMTLQMLKGLENIPSMKEVIVVAEVYMQVLNAMVTQSDAILMDPVAGFQGYPEMYKMWQMMEWLPQLYTTFIYTSLVDNHKISFFVETLTMGGPEALCQKDPAELMTNPPFMNIQFSDFYSLFCSVNFTLLQDEAMVFIQQKKISDTYGNLGNLTDAADIEALMSEYERLSKAVEQFISKTSEFKIPGFDNLTIWEKATEFLGNVSMERANINALQYSQNMTLQMLNGLENIPSMKEVIVVAEVYMQVLNAMVTQSNAILMDPVAGFQGYPEMYKMWQMMEWLPQLYTTFIYTSLVDNHKITFFVETLTMGGPEALCQKDPAALMTNPPFMNIQFADFYSLFCSVNFTLLQDEVIVFIQQKKISDTYGNLGNLTDTADVEAVMSEYERLAKVIEEFVSRTPDFKIPGFENFTLWEKAMEFLGNVSMDYANVTALQYSQNQTLQTLRSLQMVPGMKEVIVVAEVYMQVLNAMATQSEAMFMDPVAGFQGYPEMYKMWQMMEWLPQLYTTFIYTSLVDNHKIAFFVETIVVGGPEALCQKDPAALMTNPPFMNIQFADFYSLFCSVNFTLLQDEVMVFIQQKKISDMYGNLGNLTDTADIDALMSEYERLSKVIEQFANKTPEFKIPGFENLTLWEKAMEFLGNVSMDMTTINSAVNSTDGLLEMLSSLSPDFQNQLKVLQITYHVLERMLDRLENMSGDSYKLEDFFYGYGEMQRILIIMQEPGVMDMLAASLNTPQFTKLLENTNATAVLEEVCSGNISAIITVPPSVTANLTDVRDRFCKINFDILMQEFADAFFINEIMSMMSDNQTVSWRTVTQQNARITERLQNWLANPPMVDIPELWENATYWLELLNLMNDNNQAPAADNGATISLNLLLEEIEKYLGTEYSELINAWTPVAVQLGALLEMDENAKKTFATIDIFLGFMVDRLSDISDNYTIEDLSKNSTDIVRFMQALQDLKDTSGAGYDSLNDSVNLDKLYEVLLDPETLMKMCDNDSVAAYLSTNGTSTRASRALAEVICFDTTTWLQVLQDQVKLKMFEEKLTEIWSSPSVNLNWTSLSNNTQMFLKLLLGMIQSPPSPSSPLQQWASWDDMISFLSKAYMDPNILMNLIKNINPLVGTEMNNLTNAFNKLLMPFIKQLQGGDIEEIFTNPEKLLSIIQSIASLDDWLDVTSAVIEAATEEAKPTRESILEAFVCQESERAEYRDYLIYSLTVHPDFIMYLCGLNLSSWDSFLLSWGYSADDVNIINVVFERVVEDQMQEYEENRNTINMLQDVMKQLKTLNLDMLIDGYYWLDWIMSVQSSRDSFEDMLSLMEMLGDASTVMEFKRSLLVIVEIQDYINMMLNKLQGNESIPITDILPSSASVSRLLELLTSSNTVSSLTLAYVDPAKFISLLFTGEWHATFCNMTIFRETFTFPSEVNVTMLQHQLCSDFTAQKQDLDEVMKSLNLETIIRQIEKILNNETVHADNETWAYMETLVERLARNLAAIENVSITGWDDWVLPVLKSLETLMNNTQDDSIVDTCDQVFALVKETPVYMDWIRPYLNSAHSFLMISHSVMTIQLKVDEAVCKADDKNITRILNHLKEHGLSEEINKLGDYLSMKTETEFDCTSYPKYSSFFETLIASLTSTFDGSSNIVQCVTDSVVQAQDLIMDISKLFSIGSDISSLLQDDNLRAMLAGLLGSNQSLAMLDEVLNLYNMQEQAVQQLEDALRANMTDITAFLQGILVNGTDAIFQALNVTYLKNIQNLTASELIDSLCTSDSSVVPVDPALKSSLCGNDTKLANQVADSLLEYAKTVQELQNLAEYDSDAFWEKIMTDLSKLIGNIEGLSSLTRLVDRLGKVDIFTLSQDKELLRTIKELLVDNGPDTILANLNTLLDNFRVLDNSNLTHAILDDVRTLAEGVFAFTSLRNMFLTNVKITELVKDPAYLRDYIINLLSFLERGEAEAIADAILDGSLSIDTLFAAAQVDISGWICNSTQLEELLVIKNTSGINAADVSERFCSLDTNTLSAVVDEVLAQLDIGNLMEDLVNNGMGEILRKSNISMANTKASIKNLVNANQDLRQITKKFNEFSATIPDAFASLAQAQTGNQEFGSLSAILCGNALPIISDEFGTGATLGSADLTDSQRREMETLPGKSCQDMFVKIMQDRNGPIIWAYLKPLLRGKILFTPDTPDVRQIINKINATFTSLEEFIALAIDWAEGSVALGNLTGKNARDLQDLLSSKVIKSMMTQVAGVDASALDDILYTLEDTDMEMMQGISKVAKMIKDYVSCLELDRFEGYETELDMESKAASYHRKNELLAGVVFSTSPDGFQRRKRQAATSIPKHIHYTIRMDLDNVPDTRRIKQRMWRPQPNDNFMSEMRYFRGFAQLQDMIDDAIISLHVGPNVTLPTTTTNQFPFPCHTYDVFVNTIAGYLLNVLMTLSWLAAICVAVYNLVYDRERGQEETLNAMGLKYGLNWIAWFFSTMLVMAFVCLVDVIILKYGKIFIKSDMGIVYLYFLDFIFSTIMLCYFVSAFFTRTSLAILASIIVYIVSYLPFVVLYTLEVNMTFWQKTLACLSSTTAFSYAAQYIARYEEQQVGLTWDNIDKDPIYDDGFSFSWCCIMIIIDAGIYLIFGWYVRNVKPGKFGVSEPWYFPFKPSYWCCCSGEEDRYAPSDSGIFAEEVKSDVPVVMSARGLSKTFSDGTKAVKNLSLDIYAGNVTTLLGHNGAAKTTTMTMLTGILEPSKGCVQILNRPLRSMRGSVGICSQHNALYDYMTVKEHMHFYSSMKEGSYHGLSANDEVRQLLKDVDLYYCRNMLVKQLSGGMQRRLCVALAFVGGSKVVILDEPTSGVDPSGRRAVWNLIIRKKSGTAVLLSTHHLDEADIISDQIAIMHEGKLLCQGSPMFLKHHLASGHRLTITKINTDTDPVPVLTLIKRWIPGVKLESTAGAEMNFVLPAATEAEFYGLFRELDEEKHALNIESYGISDPKLEEVFLKVCSAADIGRQITPESIKNIEAAEGANGANGDSNGDWKHDFEHSGGSNERLSKNSAHRANPVTQFGAILVKRFHHYRRDWRILLSVLVLPLLLFLLAAGLYQVKPGATSQPSIYLSPAMYGPNSHVFMQQQSSLNLDNKIVNTFMVDPGIGTSCMTGMNPGKPYQCVTPDTAFTVPPSNTTSGQCTCNNNEYRCVGSPYGAPPPQRVTTTTDILQDLNGRDINLYLLDSYPEFIQKRYGGWSFENTMENLKTNMKSKIWYDNQGYHALPAFMNAYSNGLLRALVNDSSKAPEYGISIYNHPFMFGKERLSRDSIVQHAADMGIAIMILLAFTFVPVGVLLYSVSENVSKEKHMQFVSGVGTFTYWISSLFWDGLVQGVAVSVAVIILVIFKPDSFWDERNLEATVVLLLLYGWSTITLAYFLVKRFQTSGAAFFTLFCSLMFLGIICVIVLFAFNFFQFNSKSLKKTYEVIQYVFLIFPPYALVGGLLELIDNQIRTEIFLRFNVNVYKDPFSFPMVAWNMVAMAIAGFVFFMLTLWLDTRCCCSRRYECSVKENEHDDSDVVEERHRIDRGDCRQDVVVVRNLHKIYTSNRKEVHAVNGLSFGVPSGQCFGLLGVNGAGKTSTFNILTGQQHSSAGSCSILGHIIEPGTSQIGKQMGYCPQEDALDPYLSVISTLYFHAKLKGLTGSTRKQAVDKVLSKLELNKIQNKIVKACSGGMKRKLSLGIALLGDPAVVLLDEPTSGMDPKAKRLVWNCLLEAKRNGQAIILTSHSLEECDILCDRIGIMVNGEFKCLGSSQHLKQKYGDGYTVTLSVSGLSTSMSRIFELIQKHFPTAAIRDQHLNVIQLDIPRDSVRIADMFAILEREKSNFNIVYYTVSQTTLDTIFLNFARDQTDGENLEVSDDHSAISDRDHSSDSTPSSAVGNPYYGYTNPSLSLAGDKDKRPASTAYDSPYILPAKNSFSDGDADSVSYSTRL